MITIKEVNRALKNVRITKHAKERILQRFRLFLTPSDLNHIDAFIRKEVEVSKVKYGKYVQSSFYQNKNTDSGGCFVKARSKNLIYYLKIQDGVSTVITVIKPKVK